MTSLPTSDARLPHLSSADPGAESLDWLGDFEVAAQDIVAKCAERTSRLAVYSKFRLKDIEVTAIPEGDRVRLVVSQQFELYLDKQGVLDMRLGIGDIGAALKHLGGSIVEATK